MADDDTDYYALLGVQQDATLQQIKTAYRKESLKVHPDRNPDNPEAATLFHQLNSAFSLLSDASQRAQLDTKLAALNARKARFAALDNKRKAMAQDLEQRERDFKRKRGEEDTEKRRKEGELERLKEEGRRMREARAAAQAAAAAPAPPTAAPTDSAPGVGAGGAVNGSTGAHDLGPLDKTLKLKWLRSARPELTSPEAVERLLGELLAPHPAGVESVVLSSKTLAAPSSTTPSASVAAGEGKKPKPLKFGTAVASFLSLSAAVRAVKGKKRDVEGRWEGVEVEWAAGEAPEAVRGELEEVEREMRRGGAGGGEKAKKEGKQPPSFSSAPSSAPPTPSFAPSAAHPASASEDSILSALRAREKERERLMEEMRRQDEEDERNGAGSV